MVVCWQCDGVCKVLRGFEISKPPMAREMRGQRRLSCDRYGFEVCVEISLDLDEFFFVIDPWTRG